VTFCWITGITVIIQDRVSLKSTFSTFKQDCKILNSSAFSHFIPSKKLKLNLTCILPVVSLKIDFKDISLSYDNSVHSHSKVLELEFPKYGNYDFRIQVNNNYFIRHNVNALPTCRYTINGTWKEKKISEFTYKYWVSDCFHLPIDNSFPTKLLQNTSFYFVGNSHIRNLFRCSVEEVFTN
jgi:hypothetical protein